MSCVAETAGLGMRKRAWLGTLLACGISAVACSGDAGPVGSDTEGSRILGTPGGRASAAGGTGAAGSRSVAGSNATPQPGAGAARGSAGRGAPGNTAGAAGMVASGGRIADAAGVGGTGGLPSEPALCPSSGPSEFEANPSVGRGGSRFKDSDHFRVYGNAADDAVDTTLNHLEAAYSCFVTTLCFRSPGLSVRSDDGPFYKLNVYGVGSLGNAAGVMQYDARAGLSYLEVVDDQLPVAQVTVHEFGHSLALTEYNWVDQVRTGAWWETVANWVADTYLTSALCADARARFGVREGNTIINVDRVIGESYLLLVSTQNYYEAWPFLTYLTNNPDDYPGLGRTAIREMMRRHPRNNETPLHVLERVASPVRVQTILGRYWARMAYLDIGHPSAQEEFLRRRGRLNFANLEAAASAQTYRVRANRRPQYGGANIIPLTGSGAVTVAVTNLSSERPESDFTATLSIRSQRGVVRYVDLPSGAGQATLQSGEEASLVVVNTPKMLYSYDAFKTEPDSPEAAGLNYEVRITGAVPAH